MNTKDEVEEDGSNGNGRSIKMAAIVITCAVGLATIIVTSVRFGNDMGEFRTMLRNINMKLDDYVQLNGKLQTKLEEHESRINAIQSSGSPVLRGEIDKIKVAVEDLRMEVAVLNRVGSPAVQRVSDQLAEVKRLIELHTAATPTPDRSTFKP